MTIINMGQVMVKDMVMAKDMPNKEKEYTVHFSQIFSLSKIWVKWLNNNQSAWNNVSENISRILYMNIRHQLSLRTM